MIWNRNNADIPIGTKKIVHKYAWWPTTVGSRMVWLDWYVELYQFDRMTNDYHKLGWNLIMRYVE